MENWHTQSGPSATRPTRRLTRGSQHLALLAVDEGGVESKGQGWGVPLREGSGEGWGV